MSKPLRYLNWISIVVIAGAIGAAAMEFIPLDLEKLENANLVTLLLTIIFVSLVIERAVEVYANNRFDPERAWIRKTISVIETNLAFKERRLETELAQPQPDTQTVQDLRERIRKAEDELTVETEKIEPKLADLRRRKGGYTATLATGLALASAIVGVRVLSQFM